MKAILTACVFGLPVSGGDLSAASIVGVEQHGPPLWAGGAFGLESGLLGIGVTVPGIFLIALWVRVRTGALRVHGAIAEPPSNRRRLSRGGHAHGETQRSMLSLAAGPMYVMSR